MSKVVIISNDFSPNTVGYSGEIIGNTVQSGDYFSIINLDRPYNKDGDTGVLVDINFYRSFPKIEDKHRCDNDDLIELFFDGEGRLSFDKTEKYLEEMIDILEKDDSYSSKKYVIDSINILSNGQIIKSSKIINFLTSNLEP